MVYYLKYRLVVEKYSAMLHLCTVIICHAFMKHAHADVGYQSLPLLTSCVAAADTVFPARVQEPGLPYVDMDIHGY